jgi:hypothetical protein
MSEVKPNYETKALTASVNRQITVNSWRMVWSIAKGCNISPIQVLTAYEYGIPLSAAKSAVYVYPNGMNTLAPKVVWGKIITHPELESYTEKKLTKDGEFEGWELTLKRTNGISATRSFTMTEAKIIKQGKKTLAQKVVWMNYPERMCFWRAMSAVQDVVFPDVTFGIYKADELGAEIEPDGEIIDAESWELPPLPDSKQKPPSLDQLIEQFGTEACLKAGLYNLSPDATDDELWKLAIQAASEEYENET